MHGRSAADDRQAAAVLAGAGGVVEDQPQATGVEERHVAQVDDDVALHAVEGLGEPGRGDDVEIAARGDHGSVYVAGELDRELVVHGRPGLLGRRGRRRSLVSRMTASTGLSAHTGENSSPG